MRSIDFSKKSDASAQGKFFSKTNRWIAATGRPVWLLLPKRVQPQAVAPRAAHTWYRMQGCIARRGIEIVRRGPSWFRLNMEYHKALAPFFIPS